MFVASGIQHDYARESHVFSAAYTALPHFPTLSHSVNIFEKKVIEQKNMFRFSLQRFPETFLILRRIERDAIKSVCQSSCKVPIILVVFY